MRLSSDGRAHLREHGWVRVPSVVPAGQVAAALRAINHSLGEGIDPARLVSFRDRTFCPELSTSALLNGLFNDSPAAALAASLFGPGRIETVDECQIALRFPGKDTSPRRLSPHLDGMYTPTNGVTAGMLSSFTALVCVLLSDLPGPDAGNFTLWPGSHRRHAEHLREHGAQTLLAHGRPDLDLGEPLQITGRAGDIVLAHYLLGHAVATNLSPHVRYAVFFRLREIDHAQRRWQALADPWLEWPGMAEAW